MDCACSVLCLLTPAGGRPPVRRRPASWNGVVEHNLLLTANVMSCMQISRVQHPDISAQHPDIQPFERHKT